MDWQWILAITTVFLVISGLVDGINGYQWRSFFSKTNQVTKLFGKPQGLGWWSPITRALNGGESVKKNDGSAEGVTRIFLKPTLWKTRVFCRWKWCHFHHDDDDEILWLKHEFLQKNWWLSKLNHPFSTANGETFSEGRPAEVQRPASRPERRTTRRMIGRVGWSETFETKERVSKKLSFSMFLSKLGEILWFF